MVHVKLLDSLKDKQVLKILLILSAFILLTLVFRKFVIVALLVVAEIFTSITIGIFGFARWGLELATLTTVIAGMVLGPFYGFTLGMIMVFVHLLSVRQFGFYVLWVIPTYGLLGLAAALFSSVPINTFGTYAILVVNGIFLLMTAVFTASNLLKYFKYMGGNILLNLVLFNTIAPLLLRLAT